MTTKIEWTNETDNPIRVATGGHWCRKVSAGCANCYAETINNGNRFNFASGLKYGGPSPNLVFDSSIPQGWKNKHSPKRRFVCSMTDLFGEWVNRDWQWEIFDGAAAAPSQTIQILTKRPQGALESAAEWCKARRVSCLPSNLWMGVTTEDQQCADERIPTLVEIPAAVRFVSMEPLLERVHIPQALAAKLDWAILGGESGGGSRPCGVDWFRPMVAELKAAGVAVFVKQLGAVTMQGGDRLPLGNRFKKAETLEQFGLNIREFPATANFIEVQKQCQTI